MPPHHGSSVIGVVGRSFSGWLIILGFLGCSSSSSSVQRLEWTMRSESRFVDRQAQSAIVLPPVYAGSETWWVSIQGLVIEGRGVLRGGRTGELKTWILPQEGWVFSYDLLANTLEGVPMERFYEERERQARALMVETVRAESRTRQRGVYRPFLGDLYLQKPTLFGRREGTVFAAVPGRMWKFFGGLWGGYDCDSTSLALAFDGVTRPRAHAVGDTLNRFAPEVIEEIALPRGQQSRVLVRELESVSSATWEEAMEGFPADVAEEIQNREKRWRDFRTLWRFLEDPDSCPESLDVRGVRVRLEKVVTAAEVPTVRELLYEITEIDEQEELFMILHAASPDAVDAFYQSALSRGNAAQVLAIISVLSLRDPEGLVPTIGKLLNGEPEFWKGLGDGEARESRIWLEGVRRWLRLG